MSAAPYAFEQLDSTVEFGRPADVLSAAWAEAEAVRAAAHAEGFAAGQDEGRAAFRTESAPALAALGVAASALESAQDGAAAILERQAAMVAIAVAEQILAASLAIDPEVVVGICRGALRRLDERSRVTAIVNPADLDVLQGHAEALVLALGGIERFEVQADRRVGRGGCLLRTSHGEIDATLQTQLERARAVLETAMASDDRDA